MGLFTGGNDLNQKTPAKPQTQTSKPQVRPEKLPHAIVRMRSHGFNDNAIRGQIKVWHPDWSEAKILNSLNAAQPVRTTYGPKSAGGAYAKAMKGGTSAAPGLRTDDLQALRRANNAPANRMLGEIANPLDTVGQAVGATRAAVAHPGVGTGVGAGIAMAGLLPFGKLGKIGEVLKTAEPLDEEAAVAGKSEATQKIAGRLTHAKSVRTRQEAGYSVERGKRVAAAEQAMHSTPGMAGFHAARSEHKGELPKLHFSGFGDLTPEHLDEAAEIIKNHPHLQHYEKIRVAKALEEAVNEGKVPTRSDLGLIEHVFGKDTSGILSKPEDLKKYASVASELWNAPRAITASVDASGLFRQALVLGVRHPNVFRRNIGTYLGAMAKESNYTKTFDEMHSDPVYPMANTAGLAITDLEHGLGNREEALYGMPLVEKANLRNFPGLKGLGKFGTGPGDLIRMSGRGYTAGLDKMRFDAFKQILRVAQGQGVNIHDEKFLKDLGRHINTMTGRGQSGSKAIEQAMPFLNNLLFSPRLLKSRFDIFFNPAYYMNLHPFVRREAMKAAFSTLGAGMTILGLAAMAGGQVGIDPTSADFGKIRLGKTRIDIWGGFQQPARLLAQIAEGHVTSTTTGKVLNLGPTGPGKLSRGDIALRFAVSKLAPSPSFVWDAAFGRNQIGQKFHVKPEIVQRMIPLALQDANDLRKQHTHDGMDGIDAALGGYLASGSGLGVQTYSPKAAKVKPLSGGSSSGSGLFSGGASGSGGLFTGGGSSGGGLFGR